MTSPDERDVLILLGRVTRFGDSRYMLDNWPEYPRYKYIDDYLKPYNRKRIRITIEVITD